jgi:hypothetical protein
MTKITTPVADFTGDVVGVTFVKGTGQSDDPVKLAYFGRHGYTIEQPAPEADAADTTNTDEPPADDKADAKTPAKGK